MLNNCIRLFKTALSVISLLFGLFTESSAQIFPIQSTPQLIPPYSVNLPDYALNDKLRLVLLQRDLSQPSYNLRLRMKIELNGKVIMQTTQGYNPPPIQVSPGLPLIVTGPELLPYLDARNMDFIGYSRDQYLKSKSLPEGAFTISFTAYDFYRPTVQVSNQGSVFAYLMKAEPPMINLPFCGTVIPNQLGGSIMFQWLPRNTSSPNSAMNTEYVFELFEIRPKGANPNAVVQQLRPVFTHRQSNSTFIYGPAELLLLDSMQYAWRVQAVDLSGTDLFRNRGYSEVCTFTYGGVPPGTSRLTRISNVQAEGLTTRMGKVSWTACENYEGCKVSYRKPGKENVWFEQETSDSTVRIQKLEPSTDYEVRVQGRKGSMFGPSSETVNFRTKDQVDYTCGDGSTDVEAIRLRLEQASKVPLSFAPAGTIVQVGAFEMTITAAQNLGGGHFSGEGTVPLAFLGGMNYQVTFDDLLINEDLIGLDGDVDFVSAMDGYFAQQEIPRLPDGLFLKLYEHLEKIWANREKPRKYEQEVASALEEFKKEMAGITDSVALGKAKEVYGQMEGLKDGASNPEMLKEKVIEIVQANPVQEDFSDPYYPKGEHAGMSSPVQETEVYKMAAAADVESTAALAAKEGLLVEINNVLLSNNTALTEVTSWLELLRKLANDGSDCVNEPATATLLKTAVRAIVIPQSGPGVSITLFCQGAIKSLLCVTEQSRCVNESVLVQGHYGFINGMLQEVDLESLKEGVKALGTCALEAFTDKSDTNLFFYNRLQCLTGFTSQEIPEAYKAAVAQIKSSSTDPYFQGQAIAFATAILLPTKVGKAGKMMKTEELLAEVAEKTKKGFPKESAGLLKAKNLISTAAIDETIARLNRQARIVTEGAGEYSKVGGHHPLAKKAFEGDKAYDYKKAFSVAPKILDELWKTGNKGVPQNIHAKITGQQNSLYTAFAKTNKKLNVDEMVKIEIQAMKNVGIPEDAAVGWVVKALEDLKNQGVKEIVNIPWNGLNK